LQVSQLALSGSDASVQRPPGSLKIPNRKREW
jgi:hypothetical protein